MTRLQLKNVLVTAPEMDAMIDDLAALSTTVEFRDGNRYAALDPSSANLGVALAGPEDHPAPGELVLTAKTDRVGTAIAPLLDGGADLVGPIHSGGHEYRALIRTHAGLLVLVYGPEP
ncbi:hypothetical protein GCM10009676_39040 [Prauserella halophila]|uniref:VOC domain-containing protein n=1 Tax=Prauserella halophila TaxID=185641 RepID=A0ABN1WJC5_9PSEU|nr:hypothetical protein [Prauserella halophila]MCP2238172.1 hypothetical protein [Prauserella halophila]